MTGTILETIYYIFVIPFVYIYEILLYVLRQFFSDRVALYFIALLCGCGCAFITALGLRCDKVKVKLPISIVTIATVIGAGIVFLNALESVSYGRLFVITMVSYIIFLVINVMNVNRSFIYSMMLTFISALFVLYVIYIGKIRTMLFHPDYRNIPGVILYLVIVVTLNIPIVYVIAPKKHKLSSQEGDNKPYERIDIVQILIFEAILFLMYGVMLPSSVIAAAPMDFVTPISPVNPLWNITTAMCVSAGLFLIWGNVLLYQLPSNGKLAYKSILLSCIVLSLFNNTFFGRDLGLIDTNLNFVNSLTPQMYGVISRIFNLLICVAITYVCVTMSYRRPSYMKVIGWSLLAFVALVCIMSILVISNEYNNEAGALSGTDNDSYQHMSISKEGHNVILIMLDRGLGPFVPYILNEKEELRDQLSGFTYYRNTVSFANYTAVAATAVWGGYEYTPLEMNKRADIPWGVKTDESLTMLPMMLSERGYNVYVSDPPNASSLDIFNEIEGVDAFYLNGVYSEQYTYPGMKETTKRDYFFYGLFKCAPTCVQYFIYDNGSYMAPSGRAGVAQSAVSYYAELDHLDDIIDIESSQDDNYLVIYNGLPHNPMDLSYPNYILGRDDIDNPEDKRTPDENFVLEGFVNPDMSEQSTRDSYDVNMASLLLLGRFFDHLKEQDAYDNSRIIIVADHGTGNREFDYGGEVNIQCYLPLLLFKDFDAEGPVVTSDEFMTNADVPSLVLQGIIDNPTNPYTGHSIDRYLKSEGAYVSTSSMWDLPIYGSYMSFNTLETQYPYYIVMGDAYDPKCWKRVE